MNLGKITLITPPDKLFNMNLSYLLIKPSTQVKEQFQIILSQILEDVNVFVYDEDDHDIGWLLGIANEQIGGHTDQHQRQLREDHPGPPPSHRQQGKPVHHRACQQFETPRQLRNRNERSDGTDFPAAFGQKRRQCVQHQAERQALGQIEHGEGKEAQRATFSKDQRHIVIVAFVIVIVSAGAGWRTPPAKHSSEPLHGNPRLLKPEAMQDYGGTVYSAHWRPSCALTCRAPCSACCLQYWFHR